MPPLFNPSNAGNSAKILTQLDGEIKTLETGLFPRIK